MKLCVLLESAKSTERKKEEGGAGGSDPESPVEMI